MTFWHSAVYGGMRRNHYRCPKIPRNSVSAEFRGHPSLNVIRNLKVKDGRSANKFRKSQIPNFADLICGPTANVAICWFAICGTYLRTAHPSLFSRFLITIRPIVTNLYVITSLQIFGICDLRTGTQKKICGLINRNQRSCDLWTGTPQKFASFRLWNEPRICGFAIWGLTKKCSFPPLLEAKTLCIPSTRYHATCHFSSSICVSCSL